MNYFVQACTRNGINTDVQEDIEDVDKQSVDKESYKYGKTTYGLGVAKGSRSQHDDDSLTVTSYNKKARTDDKMSTSKGKYHC